MGRQRWRRSGAVLLVLGGLTGGLAYEVGSMVSLPDTTPVGASLLAGYTVGSVGVGLGLLATGVALTGRGRTALKVAGVVTLTLPVVSAVQRAASAPIGAAPAQLAYLLYVVAVLVAALLVLTNTTVPAGVRWSIAVPATCLLLSVISLYLPPLALPEIVVLPWAGMAAAGVLLLLRSGNLPRRAAAGVDDQG